jgi:hypothetical protein
LARVDAPIGALVTPVVVDRTTILLIEASHLSGETSEAVSETSQVRVDHTN